MKILGFALFFCMVSSLPIAAQAPPFDNTGNSMLSGPTASGKAYYFRHVYYVVNTQQDSNGIIGDVSEAVALYGNITFFPNGSYTINNAAVSDSSSVSGDGLSCYLASTTCAVSAGAAVNGTYAISASGFGFLVDPITGDNVYGLVAANGIFSGSSTEGAIQGGYSDLFIGAPVPSPLPTSFNGSYTVAGVLPGEDMSFQINPNGSGSLGTVAINGYSEASGNATISQSSNVTYTFRNGAAVLTFPTSATANFISGQEFLYFSPDGNFFFGGSPTGFDMIVGVNNTSSDQSFGACNGETSCLYYQAGIDQDLSDLGGGYADLDGYYGSFNATSNGNIIGHERLADQIVSVSTYGWTFTDSFTTPVTGAYTDTNSNLFPFQYWLGDGGTVRIGEGIGPYLGLTVAFQAPTFAPTQPVYIKPTGIVNAASFAPFTAGVANGEFITIFGTNLAPGTCGPCITTSAQFNINNAYPTTLAGVQVIVNGVTPAPIYFVAPGQLAFIMPSQNPYSLAQIQVVNNGVSSNVVTVPVYPTAPGIYTNPSGGVYAAAVDTNLGTIVTPQTPAQPGDTLEVFATGLGTAYPPVADGAAPPQSPLSYTVATIQADVDGNSATVAFAGLAPTLAGLYQINVTIPSTTTAGDHFLDISGVNPTTTALESYTAQVLISVGGGAAARPAAPAARFTRGRNRRTGSPYVPRTRTCLFAARAGCTVEK